MNTSIFFFALVAVACASDIFNFDMQPRFVRTGESFANQNNKRQIRPISPQPINGTWSNDLFISNWTAGSLVPDSTSRFPELCKPYSGISTKNIDGTFSFHYNKTHSCTYDPSVNAMTGPTNNVDCDIAGATMTQDADGTMWILSSNKLYKSANYTSSSFKVCEQVANCSHNSGVAINRQNGKVYALNNVLNSIFELNTTTCELGDSLIPDITVSDYGTIVAGNFGFTDDGNYVRFLLWNPGWYMYKLTTIDLVSRAVTITNPTGVYTIGVY